MLKYIPTSWRDDLRTNFDSSLNFYINPRGRTIPALTDAGNTYIKNDKSTNLRGTYRMQTGASTDLTYLYTLPQRFIIEGWFKPGFAYNVVSQQDILKWYNTSAPFNGVSLSYDSASDRIFWYSVPGPVQYTTVFTTDASLQKWIYVRCFFDNLAKLKGFYCTVNGVVYADSQNVPGAGTFTPLNTISFFPTVALESSYWIIHELDETLATGEYKTYQADRQIIFDFNGTTLARERIRIPRNSAAADLRGVKSIDSLHYAVENQGGSACANSAGLSLYNIKGQFSDDQYDAFDPFQGYYNGTTYQRYLQNRVGVEIETMAPTVTVHTGDADYPDNPTGVTYFQDAWATADGWVNWNGGAAVSVAGGFALCAVGQYGMKKLKAAGLPDIQGETVYLKITLTTMGADGNFQIKYTPNGGASTVAASATLVLNVPTIVDAIIPAGTEIVQLDAFLVRSGSAASIDWVYFGDGSFRSDIASREPLIIGRTTPGAFSRNSPNAMYGEVSIEIEDGVSELGETKMNQAYSFTTHDICDPAAETDSLVHDIARLVTKKTIKNYALNSSVENATIANSWTNTGMATFERSSTQALFGTYSMKCIADTIGDNVKQVIEFETSDLIDIGDTFNFSAFVYQGTASAVKISIAEFDTSGSLIGSASETACGTDTSVWTRVNVSRVILSASCTQLRIGVVAVQTSTFYVDGFMLTRGYDPLDYFLVNATDGASGVGSADSAASYSYDTVGIDADAVDIEHPYALVKKGEVVWDHLKKISDASIGYYLGMTPDGTLRFANRYAEAGTSTPSNLGTVDDFGGVSTSLEIEQANAIKVYGYAVETGAKTQLFSGMNASGFIKLDGKMRHPVDNGAAVSVSGATTIECVYSPTGEYAQTNLPGNYGSL